MKRKHHLKQPQQTGILKIFLSMSLFGIFAALPLSLSYANTQINMKPLEKTTGPYYKLTLPTAIYATSLTPSLDDVRIQNASGEFLSYAWLNDNPTSLQFKSKLAPLFPLFLLHEESDDAHQTLMNLKIAHNGSLIQVKEKNITPDKPALIKGWIIDTSQLIKNEKNQTHLLQARFAVAPENEGIANFSLESSDDLQHWNNISPQKQLVQLTHQHASIQKLDVDLNFSSAKYLRLLWENPKKAFDIHSVTIDIQEQLRTSPAITWSASIQATQCDKTSCEYALPKNTPIDSLRIHLAEINTVTKLTIIGKKAAQAAQQPEHTYHHHHNPLYILRNKNRPKTSNINPDNYLGETLAYRLQLKNNEKDETQSDEMAMNGQIYTHIRLVSQDENAHLEKLVSNIQIGTLPRSMVFLARGREPYHVQWGKDIKEGAPIALTSLAPKTIHLSNTNMSEAQLDLTTQQAVSIAPPASITTQKQTTKNTHKIWLWLVLGIALLLLGAMVWSFLRNIEKEKNTKNSLSSLS